MVDAFEQLHRYIRRDVQLTKQVRKALIYPCILLVVAFGVVAIIVIFVIPKFAEFFKSFGAELPLPTQMLMAIADFVGSTAGLVTGILLVSAIVGTVLFVRTPSGRRGLHSLLLKIPVLNTVVVYGATERFTRILAVLLDAGVPLTDAMPSAIECTTNVIFRERLTVASEAVLAGEGFAADQPDRSLPVHGRLDHPRGRADRRTRRPAREHHKLLRGGTKLRGRQADPVVRAAHHPHHRRGGRVQSPWR